MVLKKGSAKAKVKISLLAEFKAASDRSCYDFSFKKKTKEITGMTSNDAYFFTLGALK
jgi:hypothetical protein